MSDLDHRFPIYSRLLKLYPAVYRKRYTPQMLQTLADMLDACPSAASRAAIWARTVFDLPLSVVTQQLSFAGHVLASETPEFVRRNATISTLFFAPFFILAVTNDIAAHRLYHTWLWSFDVLITWVVVLPALGTLLSVVTLVAWLRGSKRSWWRGLRDLAHNWMMLLPLALGASILLLVFFHDSVHCVTGNPIRMLHNPHDTFQCIERR